MIPYYDGVNDISNYRLDVLLFGVRARRPMPPNSCSHLPGRRGGRARALPQGGAEVSLSRVRDGGALAHLRASRRRIGGELAQLGQRLDRQSGEEDCRRFLRQVRRAAGARKADGLTVSTSSINCLAPLTRSAPAVQSLTRSRSSPGPEVGPDFLRARGSVDLTATSAVCQFRWFQVCHCPMFPVCAPGHVIRALACRCGLASWTPALLSSPASHAPRLRL